MTRPTSHIQRSPLPDWLLLLRLDMNNQDAVRHPLIDSIFAAFELYQVPAHISKKIISSIENDVVMALQTEYPELNDRHVILSIYILPGPEPLSNINHNWGFFRVEKLGAHSGLSDSDEHRIDFYLYPDG